MNKKKSIIKKYSVALMKARLIAPFRTALGQHDILENILFGIELSDGTKGFGEAAVAEHITGETISGTIRNLKKAGHFLEGKDISDFLSISGELNELLTRNRCALAAAETAIMDGLTRQRNIPLWKFFGLRPQRLTTDITIVLSDVDETTAKTKMFYRQGFRTFKVKIGRDMDMDLQRVAAVHKVAKGSAIYLDANQGFHSDQILNFVKWLGRRGITPALIEQPVAKDDWEGLIKVSRLAGIPVCADESVASLKDAVKVIKKKAAQAINVKLMKFGLFEARDIILLAKANGIKLMVGGMMESSLAMTTSAHLAAGLGGIDYVDLDTPFFIRGHAARNPYLSRRGVYDLKNVKAGIGIRPKDLGVEISPVK